MRLIVYLALRDLLHERVQLACNIAVLAGVIVPLMVLFGVKNGVYDALVGRLLSDPRSLQIDTLGNESFGPGDAELVRGWEESGFVTLKTRSVFDYVNIRVEGGRTRREALLVPSGTGDPNLPTSLTLGDGEAAVSAGLARQLDITVGQRIQAVTQAEDRPRQLLQTLTVVAVLPEARAQGRSVLASLEVLDRVEAFYDAYALPEFGITAGRPLAERSVEFEGLRSFARRLEDLAPLQARIESEFGIGTEARTAEVSAILGLGKNLDLAMIFTAAVAGLGLAAALVFGFWGEIVRKRRNIAALALLGIGGRALWLYPVIQSLVAGVLGLVVSFLLFWGAAEFAERLFDTGLTAGSRLVSLGFGQLAAISALVVVFVVVTSLFAARDASQTDPAEVLREGAL
ncbi:MAG: ABC transporter permease [Pseudomonadota bacterium]